MTAAKNFPDGSSCVKKREFAAIIGRILFLLFLIVPLIEIGLFILLGQAIGLWPTLLGVVVTALIGSFIVRRQGLALLMDFRQTAARGALPGRQIAEGMMLAIAGALLLTPGYFTDTCGFLLLVPAIRLAIYTYLKSRVSVTGSYYASGDRPRGPEPHRQGSIDLDDDEWRRDN